MDEIQYLKKLVSFPTFEEKGMKECSEFLEQKLDGLGFKTKTDKLMNVFGVRDFGGSGNFLLNAHFDTVGIGNGWKTEPLKATQKKGLIYGLGVTDDKGSIACLLNGLHKLGDSTFGKLYILLSNYEESRINGLVGTEFFLKNNKLPVKQGINLEPSVFNGKFTLRIGCGGRIAYGVKTMGKETHSSAPQKGVNAIHAMGKVIDAIKSIKPVKIKLSGNELQAEFSINKIQGGRAMNIIPGECTAVVERRLIPGEDIKKVRSMIEPKLKRAGANYQLIRKQFPYMIEPGERIVVNSQRSMKEVLGYSPKLKITPSRTDSTYLYQINRTKTVIIGPGENPMCHQPNEWIDLRRMKEFTQILIDVLGNR
jgi:acetylornithine deacetylase/succinyl-diaminopimelate desuccinylase-like protein